MLSKKVKIYLMLKKKDDTVRFPYKFKSYKYFTSFMLDYGHDCGGFKISNNQLIINLLSASKNSKKLKIDLPLYSSDINETNIKTITFKKENNNYYLIFVYSEKHSNTKLNKDNYLSIDLGYSTLLKQKKLNDNISELQSKKDKLIKETRIHEKINKTLKRKKTKLINKQKDFQHKASKKVIDFCVENDIGKLIVGDLKVKNVNKKENKVINGLSKSTSCLGRFKTFLEYKSENVNIKTVFVDEYNTSKMNCLNDKLYFDSNGKNRKFIYENIEIDRDLNSSINILKKSGEWLSQEIIKSLLLNKISKIKIY